MIMQKMCIWLLWKTLHFKIWTHFSKHSNGRGVEVWKGRSQAWAQGKVQVKQTKLITKYQWSVEAWAITVICEYTRDNYSSKFKGSELAWEIIFFLPWGHQNFSKGHITCHESQHFLKQTLKEKQSFSLFQLQLCTGLWNPSTEKVSAFLCNALFLCFFFRYILYKVQCNSFPLDTSCTIYR